LSRPYYILFHVIYMHARVVSPDRQLVGRASSFHPSSFRKVAEFLEFSVWRSRKLIENVFFCFHSFSLRPYNVRRRSFQTCTPNITCVPSTRLRGYIRRIHERRWRFPQSSEFPLDIYYYAILEFSSTFSRPHARRHRLIYYIIHYSVETRRTEHANIDIRARVCMCERKTALGRATDEM